MSASAMMYSVAYDAYQIVDDFSVGRQFSFLFCLALAEQAGSCFEGGTHECFFREMGINT